MVGSIYSKKDTSVRKKFTIILNVPSIGCIKNYMEDIFDFKLSQHGVDILFDHKHQDINSPYIHTFYENFGVYPRLEYNHKYKEYTSINGGIPQNVSLHEHFLQIKDQIDKIIPDINNNGLAIIDWESWNPLFEMNFGHISKAIKEISLEWYKQNINSNNYNQFNNDKNHFIKQLFDIFARKYVEETLLYCKKLRKQTIWGLYGFPRCYQHTADLSTITDVCSNKSQKWNNQLDWMYKIVDVLAPSLYLYKSDDTPRLQNIQAIIQESIRIKNYIENAHQKSLTIIPYFRYLYTHNGTHLLSAQHTKYLLCQLISNNIYQMVVWGNINDFMQSKQFCKDIRHYFIGTLIPTIQTITNNTISTCMNTPSLSHI